MAEPVLHVLLMTAPSRETARTIAENLVLEQLAACCNLLPGVESIYRWQGEIEREEEVLVVIKSTLQSLPELKRRVSELHPYETPELIALPVEDGLEAYIDWVRENSAGG